MENRVGSESPGFRWRRLFVGIALVVIAVAGGVWWWDHSLETEYEELTAELLADGQEAEWGGLPNETDQATFDLFRMAADAYEEITEDLEVSDVDTGVFLNLRSYDEADPWSEEERALAVRAVERFKEHGLGLVLDAVAAGPFSLPAGEGPLDQTRTFLLIKVVEPVCLYGHLRRGEAGEVVDLLFRLMRNWQRRAGEGWLARTYLLRETMKLLRRGIEDGSLDPASRRDLWLIGLRAEETRQVGAFQDALRLERAVAIEVFEEFRRGKDRFEDMFEDVPFLEIEGPLPHWYCRRWGRPFLHRRAIRMLEVHRAAMESAVDIEGIRDLSALPAGPAEKDRASLRALATMWLEGIASLRLGRSALLATEEDGPELEPLLAEPDLADPFTGLPFRSKAGDDGTEVFSAYPGPARGAHATNYLRMTPAERREYLRGAMLSWRIE